MSDHVYGILGDGEVSTKFLTDTLNSLQAVAAKGDTPFWVILPYELQDDALTDAIADAFQWAEEQSIWVRAYAAKPEKEDEQPTVEEFVVVKKGETPAQRMVKDLVEEGGELLVLAHTLDWDEPKEADEALLEAITAANQNGVTVKQLNNGMIELDFTEQEGAPEASESDEDGPSEADVRQMGTDADEGSEDAAAALSELGAEYGLDIAEEPYASMSWSDYAEAVLTADAEKANAEVAEVEPEKQPQKHDRAKLEKQQLRQLRSLAIAEGWGKADQGFPKWFLVEHLASGTVPTDEVLANPSLVPDQPGDEPAAPKRGRGRAKLASVPDMADVAGEPGDHNDEATTVLRVVDLKRAAQLFRELADTLDPA